MIPWRLLLWLALAAGVAGAGWWVKGLVADNVLLRGQVAQWQGNYESLGTLWKQERDALSSREAAYQALSVRNHSLNQKLSEALTHAAQTDACVATPVPPAVDQRLRELYRPAVPERAGAGNGADAAP